MNTTAVIPATPIRTVLATEHGITVPEHVRLRGRLHSWRGKDQLYHARLKVLVNHQWITVRNFTPSCSLMGLRISAATWCEREGVDFPPKQF